LFEEVLVNRTERAPGQTDKRTVAQASTLTGIKAVRDMSEEHYGALEKVLQQGVLAIATDSGGSRVSVVQRDVQSKEQPDTVLFTKLRRRGALCTHGRDGQFSLQGWGELLEVLQGDAEDDPSEGWARVPCVRVQQGQAGCASHRPQSEEQSTGELGNAVRVVPHGASQIVEDTVASVRRIRDPGVRVYDLQVEGNHNFFAEEVLVHNCMVIDDLLKNRSEAESPTIREKLKAKIQDDLESRLHPGSSVIVCATRWHEDDPIGWLRNEYPGRWEEVIVPAVHDGAGRPVDERVDPDKAQSLWPERYPMEWMIARRANSNEYGWWSLYQQEPRPRGASMFGEPSRFDLETWESRGFRIVMACDPAASAKTRADYSAVVVAAMRGYGDNAETYVLDVHRWQVEIPELVDRLLGIQRTSTWAKGAPILVEAVSGFKAVPQMLRRASPQLRIEEIKPEGDKFTRAQPLAAAWSAGRVHVPREAPWVGDFLSEMRSFTGVNDAHDDQVDALVHAYQALQTTMSATARFRAMI
jgi:predicted phage terminase large subunit-like protein